MARRLKYEDVKYYIEVESNSGCKLLSDNYKNTYEKLEIRCSCGNVFFTTFESFKRVSKTRCDDCTKDALRSKFNYGYDKVKEYVDSHNCQLLSLEYINYHSPLEIMCIECNHIFITTFASFKKTKYGCPQCATRATSAMKALSIEYIDNYLMKYGYQRLSEYRNCDTLMQLKCPDGHNFLMDFYHFKNRDQRCPICYSLKDKSGENSASWQGGKTLLNFMLRNTLQDWKFKSLEQHDFKCIITGSKNNLAVHHVTSFNIIIKSITDELDIPYGKSVQDYTTEEIQQITFKCEQYHKDNLGVPMTDEIHYLFHSIYGWNNNQEQLNEFISIYKQ